MSAPVTSIKRDDGTEKPWRTLASRVLEVLNAYPPQHGWAILIKGRVLEGVLMKDTYDRDCKVAEFDATLVNPQGVVIASASALARLDGPVAWSNGESRARHRLFAALGYAGDVLDLDEAMLIADFDRQSAVSEGVIPSGIGTSASDATPSATAASPAADAETQGREVQVNTPHAKAASRREPGAPSEMLVRQIKDRCEALRIEVPAFTTEAQAKAVWKELVQRKSG